MGVRDQAIKCGVCPCLPPPLYRFPYSALPHLSSVVYTFHIVFKASTACHYATNDLVDAKHLYEDTRLPWLILNTHLSSCLALATGPATVTRSEFYTIATG
jgi:hypothetical protein